MSSKTYYVYELWNPLNMEVFYVGKGTNIVSNRGKSKGKGYHRLSNHIKDTRYYKAGKYARCHKFNTISKIIDAGHTPELRIVYESKNESDSILKEIELIKFYGRRDIGTGVLTNHTDGGEGTSGYKHTKDHIKRLKENNPGGEATAIPVVAICPYTNDVKHRFKSAREAGLVLANNTYARGNINLCCSKRKTTRTAYGYYWRYLEEYDPNEDVRLYNEARTNLSSRSSKSVTQYQNGTVIKIWNSASDVCRHYGVHVSTLHRYLKSGEEWKGFTWSNS